MVGCSAWKNVEIILHALVSLVTFVATPVHCCHGGKPIGDRDFNNVFGGTAGVENFTNSATGRLINNAGDLDCFTIRNSFCRWRNVGTDALDWMRGTGQPNPGRLAMVTGTDIFPSEPYLVLASATRAMADEGLLVSDPVGCQSEPGFLIFYHWITKSTKGDTTMEPMLDVCWRFQGESLLRDCTRVRNPDPGPSSIRIPAIFRPFEIVFRGYNFVDRPYGGALLLDDIEYSGRVQADCGRSTVTSLFTTTTRDANDNFLATDVRSCTALKCSFDGDACLWNRIGSGVLGLGERGWRFTTGRANSFNPLTGIRRDGIGSLDGPFIVADFIDSNDLRQRASRYVLESPVVNLSRPVFMLLEYYLATVGLQLEVCTIDVGTLSCIRRWVTPMITRGVLAYDNLSWKQDTVLLPAGQYNVLIRGQYDSRMNMFNIGQTGIDKIEVLSNQILTSQPIC